MLPTVRALPVLALLLAPPIAAQDMAPYALRPGDRVTVDVFTAAGQRVDVVSGARIVDREGTMYLPYVGSVSAAGLDEAGLRERLAQLFGSFYDQPVVNVKVELRVNVTGSVGRPGQYYLDPSATIIDAISEAGGAASEYALNTIQIPSDQSQVRLVREGKTNILNIRPDEITEAVIQMRVHSGDWIHVPARRRSRVRDELTFWGSIVSFATGIATLIILATTSR
jgi:polysaccharide export outer membrane protein